MKLKGKTALVTGSTRGIGRAIAERFAREGALVLVNGRNPAACEAAAAEIRADGGDAHAAAADLEDLTAVRALAANAMEIGDGVDILVNNAALTSGRRMTGLEPMEWDRIMNVNLKGAFFLSRDLAQSMIQRGGGCILNISSLYAWGSKGQIHYDVSKGGLITMTRSMALELGRHNIRVNCIAPGFIETDMSATIPPAVLEEGLKNAAIRRAGKPDEVAAAALFLASGEASYITGETLHVNGGLLRA